VSEGPLLKLPKNREVAAAWIAYILGELFEEFPRRQTFSALDVSTHSGIEPRREPEGFFDDLLLWLRDNGYVRYTQDTEGVAYDVALTERGFSALGKTPDGLDRPIGAKLKEVSTAGAAEAGKAVIATTVGSLLGAAAATFLSGAG
jgi:hypothetical protein